MGHTCPRNDENDENDRATSFFDDKSEIYARKNILCSCIIVRAMINARFIHNFY